MKVFVVERKHLDGLIHAGIIPKTISGIFQQAGGAASYVQGKIEEGLKAEHFVITVWEAQ